MGRSPMEVGNVDYSQALAGEYGNVQWNYEDSQMNYGGGMSDGSEAEWNSIDAIGKGKAFGKGMPGPKGQWGQKGGPYCLAGQ